MLAQGEEDFNLFSPTFAQGEEVFNLFSPTLAQGEEVFKSLSRLHSLKARRSFKSFSRLVVVRKFNTCASDRWVAVRT